MNSVQRNGRRMISLIMLAIVWLPIGAFASISEPDHIIYGQVSWYGDPVREGELTLHVPAWDGPVTRHRIGSDDSLGDQYALRIPMNSTGPRIVGTAREGDEAMVYLGGELIAMLEIGSRGTAQRLDLDPELLNVSGLSILDTEVNEGSAGDITPAMFDVELTEPLEEEVRFSWRTQSDTATGGSSCGPGVDFIQRSVSSQVIGPGNSGTRISVDVCGNDQPDGDRQFFVDIAAVSENIQVLRPRAVGVIRDNDTVPEVSIQGVNVMEPPVGQTTEAVFRLSLSYPWDEPVTISWSTQNGTAIAGLDYVAASGSVNFPVGTDSRQVSVTVLSNPANTENRDFRVNLSSPVNATIGQGQATGLIIDSLQILTHVETLSNDTSFDGLRDPTRVSVVSPDGEHVYVSSRTDDEVVAFRRNPDSGRLALLEVIELTGLMQGTGRYTAELFGYSDMAISADGRQIYLLAHGSNGIVTLDREVDAGSADFGRLSFVDALFDGDDPDPAAPNPVTGLVDPAGLALSPDGENVYVAARGVPGFVVTFSRDDQTGALRFESSLERGQADAFGATVAGIGGARSIVAAATYVYVAGESDNSVVVFNRTSASEGRLSYERRYRNGEAGVSGIEAPRSLALSPDNEHLYVAGHGSTAIVTFRRTGSELAFIERLTSGSGGVEGLVGLQKLALSPDGEFLYAVSDDSQFEDPLPGNVVVFRRETSPDADHFGRLRFEEIKRNNQAGLTGLWGAAGLAVSPDNAHVYVVARNDQAISVFARDLLPPVNPMLSSPSHEAEAWSSNPEIEVEWSGAVDRDPTGESFGSGVAGYSIAFSDSSDTSVDEFIDVPHGTDPHSVISDLLPDSQSHWFHLRTCDNAGNCSERVSAGPYWIDATAPDGPFDLASSTHVPGDPSIPDNVIEVSWTSAVDPPSGPDEVASGLAGYSYVFNQSPSAGPNPVQDLPFDATTISSETLGDGLWWFHVRAIDVAGNVGQPQTIGPFAVGSDTTSPTVFSVSSVAAPDGDEIIAGQTLANAISQLMVRFDKPMLSTGTGSAGSAANFRLLDGHHDNTAINCNDSDAGLFDSVSYFGDERTTVIDISAPTGLTAGDYTLVACDSLQDFNSNALDGNGDGSPGGHFALPFSVEWTNLVPNPNFDAALGADNWAVSPVDSVVVDADTDAGSARTSGAAYINVEAGDPSSYVISRCVTINPDVAAGYAMQARARIDDAIGDPNPVLATVSMAFYSGPNCQTGLSGDFVSNAVEGDSAGAWLPMSTSVSPGAVAGASSVLVTLNLAFPQGDAFPVDVWFDNAHFFAFGEGDLPTEPPRIERVLSSHGTEYGDLSQPLPTEATITQLIPQFSRGVVVDAGGTQAASANNPDNYRLFDLDAMGPEADPDCSDDHGIAIGAVGYQAAQTRAVVRLAGNRGLPAGNYRLAVCGNIRDFDNNQLDGAENGQLGTDFLLDFEVATTNLLRNPNLDSTLGQWDTDYDENAGQMRWSGADREGLLSSGSLRILHQSGPESVYTFSQCVELQGLTDHFALGAEILTNQGFGPAPQVSASAAFHAAGDCAGDLLDTLTEDGEFGHSAGAWQYLLTRMPSVPGGAVSARVTFSVIAGSGEDAPFDLWLDQLKLRSGRADVIFRNRFAPEVY